LLVLLLLWIADWSSQPILAIKGAKVGDYNGGRSLSSLTGTSIIFEPHAVAGFSDMAAWRAQQAASGGVQAGTSLGGSGGGGGGGVTEGFEKRKSIAAIKDEGMVVIHKLIHLSFIHVFDVFPGLGMSEKPDYVVVKGTVVYIRHDNDPWYTACVGDNCNKKVTENMNGDWHCEKCNRDYPQCHRRYILNISMSDHSGSGWFSLFNDTVSVLLSVVIIHAYFVRLVG
jgi:replication factor A1